jgi:hypothetical protein
MQDPALFPSGLEGLPAFLRFTPVPVRARRDGWSPALQLHFVVHLARGAGVDEAARKVGRSRQTAYALRERAGAEGFVAAWDSAIEFARRARALPATRQSVSSCFETLLVPRYYRGRLIGYVEREDVRGAMAQLGVLDRLAARLEASGQSEGLRAVAERLCPLFGES